MLIVCLKTKSKHKLLKNYLSFIVYSYFIRNKVMNKQILIKNKENHKSIKNEKKLLQNCSLFIVYSTASYFVRNKVVPTLCTINALYTFHKYCCIASPNTKNMINIAISISVPDKLFIRIYETSFIRGINWCWDQSIPLTKCHIFDHVGFWLNWKPQKMTKIHFPKITWYKYTKNSMNLKMPITWAIAISTWAYTRTNEGKWNWFAFLIMI